MEVFGRDTTFDPQTDPVVRLDARRLRRDLDSYYVEAGVRDPVRIFIPKGSYVPTFERHATPPPAPAENEPRPDHADVEHAEPRIPPAPHRGVARRWWVQAGLLACMAIVGWGVFAWIRPLEHPPVAGPTPEPAVVVLPFSALGATDDSRVLASGLSFQVAEAMSRFPGIQLYTLPPAASRVPTPDDADTWLMRGVGLVVRGAVRDEQGQVRVAAELVDAQSGRLLWSSTYDRRATAHEFIRLESEVAYDIATVLAPPYGVVADELRPRANERAVTTTDSYMCVLRAYEYRRAFMREGFAPVLACLERAVWRDPDYSDA